MGAAAKFFALGWQDRLLLISASREIATTWIGLRTLGFDAMRRTAAGNHGAYGWCTTLSHSRRLPALLMRPASERIAWAVRAAGNRMPGGRNCLVRALATQSLLTRHGYTSQLRIGVRKATDGGLAAHAWLESDGAVLVGDFDLGEYTTLNPSTLQVADVNVPQA